MVDYDPEKDRRNRAKHGVALEIGARVIADPQARFRPDLTMDYGEERWIATGLVDGVVHVAVYTQRRQHVRLISVRRATRAEADRYFAARGGHEP